MRLLPDRKRWLLIILAVAFLSRAAAAIIVQRHLDRVPNENFVIAGDAAGYWELGKKLAAGEPFSIYDPPRHVMRMPGFPALLAVSQRIAGENFLAARLLLAAVGTLACGLVYYLGKQLFDETTGLIAAALTAVSPTMIGFSVLILSETLFAAAMLLSLILLAKLVPVSPASSSPPAPHPRWQTHAAPLLAGVAVALACYVRPSWLLVAPGMAVLMILLAPDKKRAAWQGTLIVAGLIVALLPWTTRNYRVSGHFVPTTLWMGPSLYDGLNPHATGDSDMTFFDDDNLLQTMSEYEVDREYRRRSWQFVRDNPLRTLELAALKSVRYWKPWPNAPQFDRWSARLAVAGFFLPVMILAIRGWWVNRHRFWCCLLTAAPIFYFAAIHMVFVSSLRYRLPAEYPLYILAAAALLNWLNKNPAGASGGLSADTSKDQAVFGEQ